MEIIAALKKDINMSQRCFRFCELDEKLKARKKEQTQRLAKGAPGVAYDSPAISLNVAQYIKLAWDAISDGLIENAFIKSELLMLRGKADEEVDLMADLLRGFKALNFPTDKSTIEEFVHINDENKEVFSKVIFDDVYEMLETMQATNDNSEDESDHTVAEVCAQFPEPAECSVSLVGLSL